LLVIGQREGDRLLSPVAPKQTRTCSGRVLELLLVSRVRVGLSNGAQQPRLYEVYRPEYSRPSETGYYGVKTMGA